MDRVYSAAAEFDMRRYANRCPERPRQDAVLELLLTGACIKEISAALGISYRTVKFHAARIYQANGVQDRIQLMAKFIPACSVSEQEAA